ncbi:MAG: hypothetical protein NTX95_02845 [Actinobacteria bacterium]|nr:hypothetical protein [Actinomycetota bacterium]
MSATANASQSALLFSTTSKDVRISGSGKAMRVSLPANAALSWFTDRPARQAGSSTAAFLVNGWQANGFNVDAPNAALVTTAKGVTMQTIVTLRNPRLSNGRVSFRYSVLGKGAMLGMETTGHPRAGRYNGELFVDDATLAPCSAGDNYVTSSFYQCVTSGVHDYRYLNNARDGWQTTYACGTGLQVHHYAVGNVTYNLKACPQYTAVGSSQRITFDYGGSFPSVSYSQNSFLGVPSGVTIVMAFDAPCGLTANPASGLLTCIVPAGSSVSIDRPSAGNTRINACGINGASSLTYDSTAAGVLNHSAAMGACDNYTAIADVPNDIATVVIHASVDTKLLLNAG